MPLCDTLLRAAEQGLYRFYTSPKILEETTRNLTKILVEKQTFSLLTKQAEDNNYKLIDLLKRLEKSRVNEFVQVMQLAIMEEERENYL
jgi:hypothetical protein